MAKIPDGVPILGCISPIDSVDTYPVIDPKYGIDGYRSVDTITERDAITNERRKEGMLVYVKENNTVYMLRWIDENWKWVATTLGGGYFLPLDGSEPMEGDINMTDGDGNSHKIVNLADGTDPQDATALGQVYLRGEFVETGGTAAEAGHPIILTSDGKIDHSLMDVAGFDYKGSWDPSICQNATPGCEYPDDSPTPGDLYTVGRLEYPDTANPPTYTFKGEGDLQGQTVKESDYMAYGTSGWAIIISSIMPTDYYRIDGTNPLIANLNAGNYGITNLTVPYNKEPWYLLGIDSASYGTVSRVAATDLQEMLQYVKRGGDTMTGTLKIVDHPRYMLGATSDNKTTRAQMWLINTSSPETIDLQIIKYSESSQTESAITFRDGYVELVGLLGGDATADTPASIVTRKILDTLLATKEDTLTYGNPGQVMATADDGISYEWIDINAGQLTTDDIENASEVPGTTATDALNTIWDKLSPSLVRNFTYQYHVPIVDATLGIRDLLFQWANVNSPEGLVITDSIGKMPPGDAGSGTSYQDHTHYSSADFSFGVVDMVITWTITGSMGETDSVTTRLVYPTYYGLKSTNETPTESEILNGTRVNEWTHSSVTITPNNGTNKYVWIAVPRVTTAFTEWYVDPNNKGEIGIGENTGHPMENRHFPGGIELVPGTGIIYDVYVQGYLTKWEETLTLKN